MRRTTTYTTWDIRTGDEPPGFELVPASDYDALAAELEAVKSELARVKTESLRVVKVDKPDRSFAYDWYMTPTGLGYIGINRRGNQVIESEDEHYSIACADCYPVRLERWENSNEAD